MVEALGLVLLCPLVGFALIMLVGKHLSQQTAGALACGAVGLAFVAAIVMTAGVRGLATRQPAQHLFAWQWNVAGSWDIRLGFQADALSAYMALIITGVGSLIHIYSLEYMRGDAHFGRYFAYLNYFVFAMLVLVTADNFVGLLIGWGNVGLASFLLIGFFTDKLSAVRAARKALVMNTIGDVGLLLGIFVILANTGGKTRYTDVFSSAALNSGDWRNWAAVLLFVACVAKSAQIPLHTWLPDAMEGPTPVSALIHAATMVTAGVYLVVRAYPLFGVSDVAAVLVPLVGAVTAIYAASCALVQNDIKRVLAYSTMSQLGYMFMAAGVGGYQQALFHLGTHAFFKALLFLAAGAVIHALDGEQDMRRMGGLGRYPQMRLPQIAFLIGTLAISGIPPFAGFFSKEAILGIFPLISGEALTGTPEAARAILPLVGWVGVITAALTAFYMFRAYFLTFHGAPASVTDHSDTPISTTEPNQVSHHPSPVLTGEGQGQETSIAGVRASHPHPTPAAMAAPLLVLTGLTVFGGFVIVPGVYDLLRPYLQPVRGYAPAWALPEVGALEIPNLVAGLAAGLLGIGVAFALYARRSSPSPATQGGFVRFLASGWYFDQLYNAIIVVPLRALGTFASRVLESQVFEGLVRGLSGGVWGSSIGARRTETGYVRNYALAIMLGVVAIAAYGIVQAVQR